MSTPDRLHELFASRKKVLSVYLTAGFPALEDTVPLCTALQEAGVDMIEIGFPFSDPLADGPTIQHSSEVALKNGMTLAKLFSQLQDIRKEVQVPLLLMGYLNPVLQFGVERFAAECRDCGINGVILPDLPIAEYVERYRDAFAAHGLHCIFLITPTTSEQRIREIDSLSTGFIYAVSSPSITGAVLNFDEVRKAYFQRLYTMALKHPVVVGFGIADSSGFQHAAHYTHGAIIGSAFIKAIEGAKDLPQAVQKFVRSIRPL